MIARPNWERPLRRRLRKSKLRFEVPRWIKDHAIMIVLALVFQAALTQDGARLLGAGGGGTGIGIGCGLVGGLLAMFLRARWQEHPWIARWTPATRVVARQIQTREAVPAMSFVVVAMLAGALVASGFSARTGGGEALAAALVSLGAGFVLAGGRIAVGILVASAVWTVGHAFFSQWLNDDPANLTTRILHGAIGGWLPVLPWSMSAHGPRAGGWQWLLFAVPLFVSLREWWRAWHDWHADFPAHDMMTRPGAPEAGESAGEETADQPAPEANDERRMHIRRQVAFAWYGLAGYLPNGPMPRLDLLIWRWFTPRERLISTLGSYDAFGWFARTRWSALVLALMAGLAWLSRWEDPPALVAWFVGHEHWYLVSFFALAGVALVNGWPSRRSRFQPWLELMEAQGIGNFPTFALLPVCPGEWLRAAAKEWALRSAWASTLWSLAIAAGMPGFGAESTSIAAVIAAPWLYHASLFPLSAMLRLVRAVSGPAFRSHGFSRSVPSFLAALLCPVPAAIAALLLATGFHLAALVALAIAAAFGGFSLRLIQLRCKGMKFDLKPKPIA